MAQQFDYRLCSGVLPGRQLAVVTVDPVVVSVATGGSVVDGGSVGEVSAGPVVTIVGGIGAVVGGNVDGLDVEGRPPVISEVGGGGGTVRGGVNRSAPASASRVWKSSSIA